MRDDSLPQPKRGVYDTRRASALSGVPSRTLQFWASRGIYVPSTDPGPRTRLWSWGDLLAVRAIHWFRHTGECAGVEDEERLPLRSVPMSRIREMLNHPEATGYSREQLHQLVAVSSAGELFFVFGDDQVIRADRSGQAALPRMMTLVRPYCGAPDLLEPRPSLRIIAGQLDGEPHVKGTRISTAVLYRLHRMGYSDAAIREMYPDVSERALIKRGARIRTLTPHGCVAPEPRATLRARP